MVQFDAFNGTHQLGKPEICLESLLHANQSPTMAEALTPGLQTSVPVSEVITGVEKVNLEPKPVEKPIRGSSVKLSVPIDSAISKATTTVYGERNIVY